MVKNRTVPVFGRDLKAVCRCNTIPVFRDCISFLTRARDGEQAGYCLNALFGSSVTDRKVQLLRQAYQLGRNPLRMLVGLQDPYAVAGLLQAWLQEIPEPLVRFDLYHQVLLSQQYQDERHRINSLSDVLKKNDVYRLRVLLPLLELLHHYCINQHSIQHAAAYIGKKFASCLLRPPSHAGTAGQSEALAVSACIAMVLDYRSLFGQSAVDADSEGEKHSAALALAIIPQGTLTAQIPKACHIPSSPMAARRLPSPRAHFLLRSEPEDFECAKSAPCGLPQSGSPNSDDIDSAFSASSLETDDNKVYAQADALDDDLVQAVDALFLESTSDLLFTLDSLCPGRASGQSNCQSYPDSAEDLFSSIAQRELQSVHPRYIHSRN